ncbi:MAG: hypothetical protein JWP36_26 [Paucimonas sp.]|nr:hypothetical protein [Paucimonas sp.]
MPRTATSFYTDDIHLAPLLDFLGQCTTLVDGSATVRLAQPDAMKLKAACTHHGMTIGFPPPTHRQGRQETSDISIEASELKNAAGKLLPYAKVALQQVARQMQAARGLALQPWQTLRAQKPAGIAAWNPQEDLVALDANVALALLATCAASGARPAPELRRVDDPAEAARQLAADAAGFLVTAANARYVVCRRSTWSSTIAAAEHTLREHAALLILLGLRQLSLGGPVKIAMLQDLLRMTGDPADAAQLQSGLDALGQALDRRGKVAGEVGRDLLASCFARLGEWCDLHRVGSAAAGTQPYYACLDFYSPHGLTTNTATALTTVTTASPLVPMTPHAPAMATGGRKKRKRGDWERPAAGEAGYPPVVEKEGEGAQERAQKRPRPGMARTPAEHAAPPFAFADGHARIEQPDTAAGSHRASPIVIDLDAGPGQAAAPATAASAVTVIDDAGKAGAASVGRNVRLGSHVKLGDGARVEDDVLLEDCVTVGPHATVGKGARVLCGVHVPAGIIIAGGATVASIKTGRYPLLPGTVLGGDFECSQGTRFHSAFTTEGRCTILWNIVLDKNLRFVDGARVHCLVGAERLPDGTRVGGSFNVDAGARVGQGVSLGPDAWIGPDAVIEDGVVIGRCVIVKPGVVIGEGAVIRNWLTVAEKVPARAVVSLERMTIDGRVVTPVRVLASGQYMLRMNGDFKAKPGAGDRSYRYLQPGAPPTSAIKQQGLTWPWVPDPGLPAGPAPTPPQAFLPRPVSPPQAGRQPAFTPLLTPAPPASSRTAISPMDTLPHVRASTTSTERMAPAATPGAGLVIPPSNRPPQGATAIRGLPHAAPRLLTTSPGQAVHALFENLATDDLHTGGANLAPVDMSTLGRDGPRARIVAPGPVTGHPSFAPPATAAPALEPRPGRVSKISVSMLINKPHSS